MSKKKKIAALVIFLIILGFGIWLVVSIAGRNEKEHITKQLAYKMLSLLEADKSVIQSAGDCFGDEAKDAWYEKYFNFMNEKGYADYSGGAKASYAAKQFTYGDMALYMEAKGLSFETVDEATGIDVSDYKSAKKMRKEHFDEIYDYLVAVEGSSDGLHTEELIICMTPSNTDSASKWQTYTDKGSYGFEGLALDRYIDCKIKAYVRGNEIAGVVVKLSDDIVYNNVWLEKGEENHVTAYIGGGKRQFDTGKLAADFSQTVGDIYIENGRVVSISLKNDTIDGKVLMASEEKIELEGYGALEVDENFHVYKTYGVIEELSVKDILVGYDLADFVVADGKICAAIISRTVTADNIRVLIMSTGFTSLFHERISLTGTGDFTVKYGDKTEKHKAGDIVDIYKDSSLLGDGRVIIESDTASGRIQILTVEKSYGNPSYRGRIEVASYDEGLVLVNDVLIEEYLYAVVPSEMPNRFGVEALKVQAVCARSYAYRQLLNNSYAKYGAHVDDSVNFQVYNNVQEKEEATEAVRETYGEVAAYDGNPITTYYYSTSCGHTSDNSVWGGSPDSCPYLKAVTVNPERENTDLSSEEAFAEFIRSTDETDFDYGYGYYRWSVKMSFSEITKSVNEYLYSRYCANPSQIKVLEDNKWVSKEIRSIGTVKSIEVSERSSGGAIMSMIIRGSEATIKVDNELNVRYLLCPHDNPITLLKGDTTTFYILPSAYCMFEEYEEKDGESGYVIRGGGYGHGIGMSQNAVSNMVKAGMKYDEILQFFFDGSTIMNVYADDE